MISTEFEYLKPKTLRGGSQVSREAWPGCTSSCRWNGLDRVAS